MRDQGRKRILGDLASIAGLFQRELGHTAQHARLFDLAGNKIAQRPEHGNLLAVGTVSHIDVLEHVGMRADNRIDTGIQENLAVLKLGLVGSIDILGTPVRESDHKVGARLACPLDIAGQVAQVQLLDAPRSAIRQRNAVCMLGVVEQRDFDAAALDNMDGVCQLLAIRHAGDHHLGMLIAPIGKIPFDAFKSLVKSMVCGRKRYVHARLRLGVAQFLRAIKVREIFEAMLGAAQNRLLVDDCDVIIRKLIGQVREKVIVIVRSIGSASAVPHTRMNEHVAHHHEGNALGGLRAIENRCKLRLNGPRSRRAGCGTSTKRKRTARKGCGTRTAKGAQKACYERATGNVTRRMKFDVMPTEAALLLRHDNPHKKREHLTAVAYRIGWM